SAESPHRSLRPLRAVLRSRRRRRRLTAISVLLVVAGSVAAIVAIVGNTGKNFHDHYTSRPAQVYREPPPHRLTSAEAKEIRRVSTTFIGSAVARQRLDVSYGLVTN